MRPTPAVLVGVIILTAAVAFANDSSRIGDPDACKRELTRHVQAGTRVVELPEECEHLDEDEVREIKAEVVEEVIDDARQDVLDNLRNWPAMTP
ncbi:hypothetical protein [Streptomyces sp. Amel2xC10]|uniref:hypothetical protein n=1 Tax=Streptomyces sp. Amel2xC10 TaxID=1305826 RepID=UPI000A0850F5|nr:hypothetical protein [Streptomyces sp. Amel2xC10]SMF64580.1 hypothetical protein SAMN02745830_05017 [Streptomyces sp. Amel2xC10]